MYHRGMIPAWVALLLQAAIGPAAAEEPRIEHPFTSWQQAEVFEPGWGVALPDIWSVFAPELVEPLGLRWATQTAFYHPEVEVFTGPTGHLVLKMSHILDPSRQLPTREDKPVDPDSIYVINVIRELYVDLADGSILSACHFDDRRNAPTPPDTAPPILRGLAIDECRRDAEARVAALTGVPVHAMAEFRGLVYFPRSLPSPAPSPYDPETFRIYSSGRSAPLIMAEDEETEFLDRFPIIDSKRSMTRYPRCRESRSEIVRIYSPVLAANAENADTHLSTLSSAPEVEMDYWEENTPSVLQDVAYGNASSGFLVQIRNHIDPTLARTLAYFDPAIADLVAAQPHLYPVRTNAIRLPDHSGLIVSQTRGALFAAHVPPDGTIPYLDRRDDLLLIPFVAPLDPISMRWSEPPERDLSSSPIPTFSLWSQLGRVVPGHLSASPAVCLEVLLADLAFARNYLNFLQQGDQP